MRQRIHRIHTSVFQEDVIRQVQEIFRQNFSAVAGYADKIPSLLDAPFQFGYRTILLVAERGQRRVAGFALVIFFPEVKGCWLDFMAVSPDVRGGGLGGALYEAVRELSTSLGARGLFYEVLPDDPALVKDPRTLAENKKRLKFYERYGARPIVRTAYETPVDGDPAPHLVYDPLGSNAPLRRKDARAAVRVILERKYSHILKPGYISKVVESFQDDPVMLRPLRYIKESKASPLEETHRLDRLLPLVASDEADLHYVKDSGYVERPVRAQVLRKAAMETGLFAAVKARRFSQDYLRPIHDPDFLAYLETASLKLGNHRPVYPYVFPIRRPDRRPKELAVRAGYYCIDTFTPLYPHAYDAARRAVDVALTGARELRKGAPVVYALCRPPGHHAERRVYGGFCYFNNAAAAAHDLSKDGRVAVLDIDFHHGNGTQDIFYRRSDVLTVSIHGHPNFAYPYFSGFADEDGEDDGKGYNLNLTLPDGSDEARYLAALDKALTRITRFKPAALVLSAGLDTLRGDPTGGFSLRPSSMKRIGQLVGSLRCPLLVVQEGGYNLRNLKLGLPALFGGIAKSAL